MTPFGDEALITGGYCTAGEAWLRGMLLKMSRNGLTENAYGIPLYKFLQPSSNLLPALTELDCFLGGLVAIGIAPQINQPSTAAVRPLFSRVRYWLELFKQWGSATAASIDILHQPEHFVEHYPDSFPAISVLVGLQGGTRKGGFGLYIGNTSQVAVQVPDNSTLLLRMSWGVPFANVTLGRPSDLSIHVFAASNATVFMDGGFWFLQDQNVQATVVTASGRTSSSRVFSKPMTGQQRHVFECSIGETISFTKARARSSMPLKTSNKESVSL